MITPRARFNLFLTRRHWNRFAQTDAYWAVLTEPEKKDNRWQVDEFFATGQRDVDATLQRVREICPEWKPNGEALDFGCGVGRLSQGLAKHFDKVTGVDIASHMLDLARRHASRLGERVDFVENRSPDLRRWPDGRFSFVLSLITLQHVPPTASHRYLAEMVRVTRPSGLIVVQAPSAWVRPPPRRRLTWWPGTLWNHLRPHLRRWLVLEPVMDMHLLPREAVEATLGAAGADILAVDTLPSAGPDIVSHRYIALRRPD